jgi:hypothetical protein
MEASKIMVKDYIDFGELRCHADTEDGCETAPIMCGYMNNCNNQGTCGWTGRCQCNDGYKSADCSEKVEVLGNLYSKTFNLNGTQWVYFQFKDGLKANEQFEFTLKSNYPMSIFISKGVNTDPTEFSNDVEIRQ